MCIPVFGFYSTLPSLYINVCVAIINYVNILLVSIFSLMRIPWRQLEIGYYAKVG